MASPQVANLAAKILAINPKLKPADVIKLIRDTADKTSDGRRTLVNPRKAILAAGGVTRQSDNRVELSREGANRMLSTSKFNLKEIKAGKVQDPRLQPGDRIEVVR